MSDPRDQTLRHGKDTVPIGPKIQSADSLDSYKIPEDWQSQTVRDACVILKDEKTSFLGKHGRRFVLPNGKLEKMDDGAQSWALKGDGCGTVFFHCLVCKSGEYSLKSTIIRLNHRSTGNATAHLQTKHGLVSDVTTKKRANLGAIASKVEETSQYYVENPERWLRLQATLVMVDAGLSFNFFKRDPWRVFCRALNWGNAVSGFDPRQSLVELYSALAQCIVDKHKELKTLYNGVPFWNLNVDLYTAALQNKKYAALRINCFDLSAKSKSGKQIFSAVLAIRAYDSVSSDERASDSLFQWVEACLASFGIEYKEDVLHSTADFGPDVRRCLVECGDSSLAEWCVAHLLNCVLVDCFGGSADPAKSKNPEARETFNNMRKVIETIKKSPARAKTLRALQEERGKPQLDMKNFPIHRWGSAEEVLRRTDLFFDELASCHEKHTEDDDLAEPFPLRDQRARIKQFYAIIHPVRKVQQLAQLTHKPSVFKVFLGLWGLWFNEADHKQVLTEVLHNKPPELNRNTGRFHTASPKKMTVTDRVVTSVRKHLGVGLFKRFFARYHPLHAFQKHALTYVYGTKRLQISGVFEAEAKDLRFSYGFDIACTLYPHKVFRQVPSKKMILNVIKHAKDSNYTLPSSAKWCKELDMDSAADKFEKIIKNYIDRTIKTLVIRAITARLGPEQEDEEESEGECSSPPAPPTTSTHALLALICDSDVSNEVPIRNSHGVKKPSTHAERADEQIKAFRTASKKFCQENAEVASTDDSGKIFWEQHSGPELTDIKRVAHAFFGFLASSGGLENDLGAMKEIIQPKRASLGSDHVAMIAALKTNPHLTPNLNNVPVLGTAWEDHKKDIMGPFTGAELFFTAPPDNKENTCDESEDQDQCSEDERDNTGSCGYHPGLSDSDSESDDFLGYNSYERQSQQTVLTESQQSVPATSTDVLDKGLSMGKSYEEDSDSSSDGSQNLNSSSLAKKKKSPHSLKPQRNKKTRK